MYSQKIEQAIITAITAHANQKRKAGAPTPYAAHPIHVGLILQKAGFDEDTVVAGFLHDVFEDTKVSKEEIIVQFGEIIFLIIAELSEDKSLPWEERKRRYVKHLHSASFAAKAVCAADKFHNLSCILEELRKGNQDVWASFRRGKEASLWFYQAVLDALLSQWSHPILSSYRDTLNEVKALSQ
jgi:(p)ppGpp synthase/HD superfamily hydrolase